MSLVRIRRVKPLQDHLVELELTNGQIIQRDLEALLAGPAFAEARTNHDTFRAVRVEAGGLAWPNGADLCPDAILWGDLPDEGAVPAHLGAVIACPRHRNRLAAATIAASDPRSSTTTCGGTPVASKTLPSCDV